MDTPNANPPSATSAPPLDSLRALVDRGFAQLGVPAASTIVLGVSGGPDSMALLHGAAHAGRARLLVAHLDHGLRPDSADDADAVRRAASDLRVDFAGRRTDVVALARAEGRSIEDAGREARYRFFEEVAPPGAFIATAHTQDDAAETVLLHLLRGAGLGGVGGIPARRGRIVRPLLHARRADLRALLDGAGIDYRDDPSNDDAAYLRNRVRAEVLPLLESLRPAAVERIARFSRLAAADDALLDELASAELARRRGSDGLVDWRDPPPEALARRVLRIAVGHPAPTAERLEALLRAAGHGRGGVRIELGAARVAWVRDRRIGITRTQP